MVAASAILTVSLAPNVAFSANSEPNYPSEFNPMRYTKPTPPPASAADQAPFGLGNFRALCEPSHLSYDDPIVYPGERGKAHLHMFFGNTLANADSTYQSLRTTGNGTCSGGPVNRTAYWAPALITPGNKVVIPTDIAIYYKNGNYLPAQTHNLPRGLRMIAGYNMAKPETTRHFAWYCSKSTKYSDRIDHIPNCPRGQQIIAQLSFPSCWDGVHLDSADHRSHMAYERWDGTKRSPICPRTHPVVLPEVSITMFYPNVELGRSSRWWLSSDRMPGMTHANGSTFHADWFGAWDTTVADGFVRDCIRAKKDCKTGDLGNRRRLVPPRQWARGALVPVPARPA